MTSATEPVRKLHYRGNLISLTQLADARQPQADASRQSVANNAQRVAESYGMSPKEALASAVKRRKWEQRNNWAQLQRATRCWLPERQNN